VNQSQPVDLEEAIFRSLRRLVRSELGAVYGRKNVDVSSFKEDKRTIYAQIMVEGGKINYYLTIRDGNVEAFRTFDITYRQEYELADPCSLDDISTFLKLPFDFPAVPVGDAK
jgi:hypothetical protein